MYDVDCFNLNKTDLDRITVTEGNTVKSSLNLFNRIYMTELFLGLKMDTIINTVVKYKLSLFIRLLKNELTKCVLEEIITEGKEVEI